MNVGIYVFVLLTSQNLGADITGCDLLISVLLEDVVFKDLERLFVVLILRIFSEEKRHKGKESCRYCFSYNGAAVIHHNQNISFPSLYFLKGDRGRETKIN